MIGFKGSNLMRFDKLMAFFTDLSTSGKHSDLASLNILSSACSISLIEILWEISLVDDVYFRISHSCLNFKRHAIYNTSFFSEE